MERRREGRKKGLKNRREGGMEGRTERLTD